MPESVGMSHPPLPLPTTLPGEFSTTDALEQGVSRARLRSQDLVAPYHRVRRRRDVELRAQEEAAADDKPYALARRLRRKVLDDMRAYATVMPAGSFFCGRTAAVYYGVPIDHPGDLEVAVIAPRRAPRAKGLKGRRVASHLATTRVIDGLVLTDPASTWAMLARDVDERELVVIGDAMVRHPRDKYGTKHPNQALATPAELQSAIATGPRPPSTESLRTAIERIRIGSSSPLETEYRLDAAAAGLPEPALDMEIFNPDGRLVGVSEFVYRDFRVEVEVEGDHHRTDRRQWNRDIEKYRAYAELGLEVVRVTSSHIRGPRPTAVDMVRSALRRHGWHG